MYMYIKTRNAFERKNFQVTNTRCDLDVPVHIHNIHVHACTFKKDNFHEHLKPCTCAVIHMYMYMYHALITVLFVDLVHIIHENHFTMQNVYGHVLYMYNTTHARTCARTHTHTHTHNEIMHVSHQNSSQFSLVTRLPVQLWDNS